MQNQTQISFPNVPETDVSISACQPVDVRDRLALLWSSFRTGRCDTVPHRLTRRFPWLRWNFRISPDRSLLVAAGRNRLIVSILFAAFGSFAILSNRRRQERLGRLARTVCGPFAIAGRIATERH